MNDIGEIIVHSGVCIAAIALGEWFNAYGDRCWNGEYYDADGMRLYPVYRWDDELDQGEIIGWEVT